jgi:hypothetical protein
MSITAPIVVDDASGDDVTYSKRGSDVSSSQFIDIASTLSEPGLFEIRHQSQGQGAGAIDRHLVSLKRTVNASPSPVTLTVNFTMAVPRNAVVTNQMVYDGVANVLDFIMAGGLSTLTTTNIEALLRSET